MGNDLESAKALLPESVHLHSMVIQSVSMNSDPTYINTGGPSDQLIMEDIETTVELVDPMNNMKVSITLFKRVHHELKD